MCLILLALQQHPDYPLVVLANRDEYYARPTRSAHWWEDHKDILAGRDLLAQGTWLGVDRAGRFAAVTNVREVGAPKTAPQSRGQLPREFLAGSSSASDYLADVEKHSHDYAGFNLVVADHNGLWFLSNRQQGIRKIKPGLHGLSNGLFDEAWPKVSSGKRALAATLAQDAQDDAALLAIMRDDARPPDQLLPSTGVSLDIERRLSSRFIRSADYGTRASTLVKISSHGQVLFYEQNYADNDQIGALVQDQFDCVRPD